MTQVIQHLWFEDMEAAIRLYTSTIPGSADLLESRGTSFGKEKIGVTLFPFCLTSVTAFDVAGCPTPTSGY